MNPRQIPATLTNKVISTVGRNGSHGSDLRSVQDSADRGCHGRYGRDARGPSNGGSGGHISIHLDHDIRRPTAVQVVRGGQSPLELSSREWLLMDAHGGDGGYGGHGESGQHGGKGYDGADATRYSVGGNGGPGGNGGNAGAGTSGANGGRGGNTSITIGENDLDLLLAVNSNTVGGRGGAAGTHGTSGDGGNGGAGGASYHWTEPVTDYSKDSNGNTVTSTRYVHHSNPGGIGGTGGHAGRAHWETLSAGRPGPHGTAVINVMLNDGTHQSYRDRYSLYVESCDVVDENMDGINEPGEYLIVRNIVVRNKGSMPSPSGRLLKMVIRESRWLDPDTSTPLTFPDSIPPNRTAVVPGQLRAFIRHETTGRASGRALLSSDTVSLLGYSDRLHRAIPEFSGGVDIIIQYPVQLNKPAYMDCMTKGDEMKISWKVTNVAKKAYGNNSTTGRAARTRLIDPAGNYVLENAAEGSNFMEDVIHNIQPSASARVNEKFTVGERTQSFSNAPFTLELQLSDPHSGMMGRIMHYNINIQISEGYEFNDDSQFLLIVNASTDNAAIKQMQELIHSTLHLRADIFNLSLTGTLIDDEKKSSILLNYSGKSIIVSGNPFTYFSKHTRYNWDLIDPQDALRLSMKNSSFLFCGLSKPDQTALAQWATLMRYPAEHGIETASSLVEHKNGRALLKTLRAGPSLDSYTLESKNRYTLSTRFKMFRPKTEKRLHSNGSTLSKKLEKHAPMRRFVVMSEKRTGRLEISADDGTEEILDAGTDSFEKGVFREKVPLEETKLPKKAPGSKWKRNKKRKKPPSTGNITVVEGLSRTANCMSSSLSIIDSGRMITRHQQIMMIASMPFHRLAVMFWNIVRSIRSNGISAEALYRNISEFQLEASMTNNYKHDENTGLINFEICMAIAWAVEHALDADIQQLCRSSPMMDSVNSKSILTHTSRIQQFVDAIPTNDSVTASEEGIELAVQVLGSLYAALRSSNVITGALRCIPGFLSRRAKLRRYAAKCNNQALLFMAPPTIAKDIRKRIRAVSRALAKDLKQHKGTPRMEQMVIRQKLKTLTGESLSGFDDLGATPEGSIYFNPNDLRNHKGVYRGLLDQQRSDAVHAKETREAMIANVYIMTDFISLTSFG